MEEFPSLETDRLMLTQLTLEDTSAVYALFSDAEVVRYYDLEPFKQPEQARRLIDLYTLRFRDGLGIRWAIREKADKRMIGSCGFNSWSDKTRQGVIGYDLCRDSWGQGLATEAVATIIDYAFSGGLPCGALHRIQADTLPGNAASEKLLGRLGFTFEGTRRESIYIGDQYQDMKCFSLLSHEFSLEAIRSGKNKIHDPA